MDSTLAWAWLSSPASSSEAVSFLKRRGCYGWWRREAPGQVRLLGWGGGGRREEVHLLLEPHTSSKLHHSYGSSGGTSASYQQWKTWLLCMCETQQCCAGTEVLFYRTLHCKGSAKSSIPLLCTTNSKSHVLRDQMCTHQNNMCLSQLLHGKV